MNEPIKTTVLGEIATVIIDRPHVFNAFDLDTISILASDLINLAANESVKGVVISGGGKVFCAGGDLKWVRSWPQGPAAALHNLAARYHQAILEIRRMKKPVIAAINGPAAGGGFSLALACDFRVMERSAAFRQAYTSSGLSIDGAGTFNLPRLVGLAKALEIAAFDRPIPSEKALEWGLVTKVVEDGLALEESTKMAHELAQKSLHSFGLSKRLLTDSFNHSLEEHLEYEREFLSLAGDHRDGREGVSAFVEKRIPVFNQICLIRAD